MSVDRQVDEIDAFDTTEVEIARDDWTTTTKCRSGDPKVIVANVPSVPQVCGSQGRALVHHIKVERKPEIGVDNPLGATLALLTPAFSRVPGAKLGKRYDADP